MPWHLPEDLAHFKAATLGDPVVMGRRTWESLPERFRPLPGRENLVVSGNPAYAAPGARVVGSLDAALMLLDGAERICVIGGGEIFRAAMPIATELIVTRIEIDVPDADTFAPEIGSEWRLTDPGQVRVAANGLEYRFQSYRRELAASSAPENPRA
ncbi:Dihydrofolate reductase [Leucobacter soli]|uniref:Dihydrofolate reductase n=2 Tax=Leucobacter soli TaxID=2812850 RepID=A0A916NKG2_9MICO|nr:Dihydrofolate reductase [Leucobacter soli]